jgi:tetratricopeptide (TPR) repeat protein
MDRARGFFDLALSGTPTDETLAVLEQSAREGDAQTTGERLRRALSAAMAAGGQGSRDGGRTRGAMMRRAASMAHRDLDDLELAFAWLGDALIAYVDPLTLDSLEGLAQEVGDPRRAEATLSRALGEVFDGPMVRQLYARRAKLRRERLDDKAGAAADLKKLHDLAPSDQAVMDELSALLTELGDYRGMVQLYEDHILRGKDMAARAELARKVARMWEEQLSDPREAADAWRRVLRMKPGDPEATQGLERAKSNMLKRPDPGSEREAYAPPKLQSSPQVAPPPEPSSPAFATSAPPLPEATAKSEPLTDVAAAAHAERPLGLLFPVGNDEITVSAPGDLDARIELERLAAAQRGDAPLEDEESAHAGENHAEDASTEPPFAAHPVTAPPEEPLPGADEDDLAEEVIIADDLAEMIDAESGDTADGVGDNVATGDNDDSIRVDEGDQVDSIKVDEGDDVDPSATLIAAPDIAASLEANLDKSATPEKGDKTEKKKKKRKGSVPPPVPRG